MQINVGNGSDRHQVRRSFTTEKAARDFLDETRGSVAAGTYVRGSRRTVDTAIDDWLTSKHRIKASTRRGYKVTLQVVRDELGKVELQKLTKRDVDDLVTALRAGRVEGRKKFSPRSVNQMLGLLIQVLATEQRQGHVVRNVAELVDKVPSDPKKFRTLTETEILRILDHKCRDGHLWTLALYGLRRGEIAGLRWVHVDLVKGTVRIAENRVYAGDGNYVVDTPKSRASARTLPLPADVVTVLKAAKKNQQRERLALGEAYQGGDYVACDEAGEPYTPGLLTFRWGKMLDDLGIDRVRLHDARHSCATLMHLKGQPIAVIAAWLGHSSAAFTMSVYAHSQGDALKAAGESFR
ncbi:site-specific integrase [Gordonia sp. i37]|uniref:tyrosine-type recombinase/integrase n=1 Tax=Gordonia sp. i37 TaxID=1961707 RepID=UPI0015552604|nr:site-specific integrase [Gordonia sp. i37]